MKKTIRLTAALLLVSTTFAAEAPATGSSPNKRILFVLTSHDKKGDTGKPTCFYLSEVTHPHHALAAAGFAIDYVSHYGCFPKAAMDLPAREMSLRAKSPIPSFPREPGFEIAPPSWPAQVS